MIFWSLSALIWFKNIKKMLLQMTSVFLQLESTLDKIEKITIAKKNVGRVGHTTSGIVY
jgi:hypothetical protein